MRVLLLSMPDSFEHTPSLTMRMPNGISGQDLLHMAREFRPDLKAIFTSGYSEQFIRGRDEADKGVPLLPKPYRRQKLVAVIRSALDTAG